MLDGTAAGSRGSPTDAFAAVGVVVGGGAAACVAAAT